MWSQMGGYMEGGEFERTKSVTKKYADAKKQYLHMKPHVARKLWKRHGRTVLNANRLMKYNDEVNRKMKPGYRTLFYGLKRNHPHNVAIVHPISFVLRRVLYSLIIVFMARDELNVLFGCLLLILTCLFMMVLILLESEWEDSLIGQ